MVSVRVFPSELHGTVEVPSSKSYTHRALILSSLADGSSKVNKPLLSRDTMATINACRALGAIIKSTGEDLEVEGCTSLRVPEDVINVENSGTTIRFMTAVVSLVPEGFTVLTGDESIRSRPMQPLLSSLSQLGVQCHSTRREGLPPIIVKGGGIDGGETSIKGDVSSQFISALLISTPMAKSQTTIHVEGRMVSMPYVDATLKMMELFGGRIIGEDHRRYLIPPRQEYTPHTFDVPGDFSSSALLMACALLAGGRVIIKGLDFSLPQADARIVDIVREMGADVHVDASKGELAIEGGKPLRGGEFDLSTSPDLLPVMAVLALRADEKVVIRGVEHARFKETDRIAVLAKELQKLGAHVVELKDGLIIEGKGLRGCSLNSHGDHRLFMAFCAAAMASDEPCVVEGLESVDVSYPNFIEDLTKLGARIEKVE